VHLHHSYRFPQIHPAKMRQMRSPLRTKHQSRVLTMVQSKKIDSDGAAMVCRHWKSKGWCRLDANCKFLHPDHERGVDARKVRVVGSADSDGISRVFDPSISITSAEGELCPVLPVRRKKRGGRNRSNRNQQIQLGNPEQDMAGLQPCFFNLYSMLHAADSPC